MPPLHDVPDDWPLDGRCCLECGNSEPDVTLRAITQPATNQQALACTRHIQDVSATLGTPLTLDVIPSLPAPRASMQRRRS
ncbi:hypothetical protein ACN2WE_30740 [Streptomyces sp. cg28]|uniref:hypothetical protein n=1 Tax=Streptomyces sp. cg28 TaxID=3403457 RepID=UPI003B2171A6